MLRFLSIFYIIVGLIALVFCVGLSMLGIGLGGAGTLTLDDIMELARMVGPIGIAGILYCWAGFVLWRPRPSLHKKTLILIGWALAYCLIVPIQFIIGLSGQFGVESPQMQAGDLLDEEFVMTFFIPIALLLWLAIQFGFLRRRT